jgi:hypothetical protein
MGESMSRGMFSTLLDNDAYNDAEKDWFVELSRSDMYWFDLIISQHETFDTRQMIVEYLRSLKTIVEESLEKRFIYFICSRVKVRFNTSKKPRYNPFTGKVKLHLLVGKSLKKISVHTVFKDVHINKMFHPDIELTEKFITLTDKSGNKTTASVHDFLSASGIDIGYPTKVQYIGYTKNPDSRPTDGAHAGLNEILYRVSNEDNDIFICFNLFKVMSNAVSSASMLNFIVPNSMTDEIGVDLEGQIIEKCFILYFDSDSQTKNKAKERGELKNNLSQLSLKNKINSIQFHYELDRPCEYWNLYSSSIKPSLKHVFTVDLEGDCPRIKKGSKLFSI